MALGLLKVEGRMDGADISAKVKSMSLKYAGFIETNDLSETSLSTPQKGLG